MVLNRMLALVIINADSGMIDADVVRFVRDVTNESIEQTLGMIIFAPKLLISDHRGTAFAPPIDILGHAREWARHIDDDRITVQFIVSSHRHRPVSL